MSSHENTSPPPRQRLKNHEGKLNGVGVRVKEKRRALKLTQNELCGRLAELTAFHWNPSEDEMYKLEAGKRVCGDLEIRVLCKALECDLLWLMGDDEFVAPGKATE